MVREGLSFFFADLIILSPTGKPRVSGLVFRGSGIRLHGIGVQRFRVFRAAGRYKPCTPKPKLGFPHMGYWVLWVLHHPYGPKRAQAYNPKPRSQSCKPETLNPKP